MFAYETQLIGGSISAALTLAAWIIAHGLIALIVLVSLAAWLWRRR